MYNYKKVKVSGVNTYELPTIPWEKMKELFRRMQEGETEVEEPSAATKQC